MNYTVLTLLATISVYIFANHAASQKQLSVPTGSSSFFHLTHQDPNANSREPNLKESTDDHEMQNLDVIISDLNARVVQKEQVTDAKLAGFENQIAMLKAESEKRETVINDFMKKYPATKNPTQKRSPAAFKKRAALDVKVSKQLQARRK